MDYSKYLKSLDKTVNYDNIDPLQKDNHNIWLIVGKKGSGKSTFVLNLLRKKEMYRRHFNNIFLVSPTAQRDDKFEKLCDELKQNNNCYDDCSPEVLNEIRERVEKFNDEFLQDQRSRLAKAGSDEKNKKKGKKPHSLLILDDCISDLNRGSEIKNIINKMTMNSRHLKLSIWIISQKYRLISTAIRANADLITFFKNENDIEKKALEEFSIDTNILDQLEKPSDFMHVVTRGQSKYFINLKPVLSIKDTKANNKPLDKAHGGFVRGDKTNDNDSVLCILQTGEIVLPRKVVDKEMIEFLEKKKGYNKKTGEF